MKIVVVMEQSGFPNTWLEIEMSTAQTAAQFTGYQEKVSRFCCTA
jgi:hypothetical protein